MVFSSLLPPTPSVNASSSLSVPPTSLSSHHVRGGSDSSVHTKTSHQAQSLCRLPSDSSSSSSGLSTRSLSVMIPTTPTSNSLLSSTRGSRESSSSTRSSTRYVSLSSRSSLSDSDSPLLSCCNRGSLSPSSSSEFISLSSNRSSMSDSDSPISSTRNSMEPSSSSSSSSSSSTGSISLSSRSSTQVGQTELDEWDAFVNSDGDTLPPSWQSSVMLSLTERLSFPGKHGVTLCLEPVNPRELPIRAAQVKPPIDLFSRTTYVVRELRSTTFGERQITRIVQLIQEYIPPETFVIRIPNQLCLSMMWTPEARRKQHLEVAGLMRYAVQLKTSVDAENIRKVVHIVRQLQKAVFSLPELVDHIVNNSVRDFGQKRLDLKQWRKDIQKTLKDVKSIGYIDVGGKREKGYSSVQASVYTKFDAMNASNKFKAKDATTQVDITTICAELVAYEDRKLAAKVEAALIARKVTATRGPALTPMNVIVNVLRELNVQHHIFLSDKQLDEYLERNYIYNRHKIVQAMLKRAHDEFIQNKQMMFSLEELERCLGKVTGYDSLSRRAMHETLDDWKRKGLCGAFVKGVLFGLMTDESLEQYHAMWDHQKDALADITGEASRQLGQCLVDGETTARGVKKITVFDE